MHLDRYGAVKRFANLKSVEHKSKAGLTPQQTHILKCKWKGKLWYITGFKIGYKIQKNITEQWKDLMTLVKQIKYFYISCVIFPYQRWNTLNEIRVLLKHQCHLGIYWFKGSHQIPLQGRGRILALCLTITSRCPVVLLVWPLSFSFSSCFPELKEDIDGYPWVLHSPGCVCVICVCNVCVCVYIMCVGVHHIMLLPKG